MKQTKKNQQQEQDIKQLDEALEANKISVDDLKEEEWEMGIDEAGRGPVFGPMVYGAALWPLRFKEEIIKRGFQDSKKLTEDQRENLYSMMQKMEGKQLRFASRILDAQTLSQQQLSSIQVNLNTISHNAARDLINWAIDEGYNIKTCYLDTVGPKQTYHAILKEAFGAKKQDLEFIVEEKADRKYQVVSAASIVAKVQRDHEIQRLSKRYKQKVGSGYPADPTTKEWLKNSFIPIFGYTNDVRFSWQTTKNAMEENGLVVVYQLDQERKDNLKSKYHSKEFFHNIAYCDIQI